MKVRKPDDSEKEKGQEAGDDSEGDSEPKSQKEKGVLGLPADNPLYNLKPYMRKLSDWDQRLNRLE